MFQETNKMTLAEANVILEAQSQQDVKLGVTKWVQNYDSWSFLNVLESICFDLKSTKAYYPLLWVSKL